MTSPFIGLPWPEETVEEIERRARAGELDPGPGRGPVVIPLGDNPDSYLSVAFEDGSVVVRDSNDPTGRAVQTSYDAWRGWVSQLRGDEGADPEQPEEDSGRERAPGQVHAGADHIAPSKTVKLHSKETDARVATPGKPGSGDDDRR